MTGRLLREQPLWSFFGLTFLFTWSLLPLAATSISVSLIALCGPAVAAVVVATSGREEDRRSFRTCLTDWRLAPHWYLIALLLPLPITAFRSWLEYIWGVRGEIELQPVSALSVVVFVLVVGEEAGWRGFALPRLVPRLGRWGASALIGIVWAFWHVPLFSMPSMPQYGSPFLPFVGYTMALSVILTVLALRTRGSVVIATLFHGAVNTFGLVNTAASPEQRGWSNALSYGVAALLLGAAAWHSRYGKPIHVAAPRESLHG